MGIKPIILTCDTAVEVLRVLGYSVEPVDQDVHGEAQWKVISTNRWDRGKPLGGQECITESDMIRRAQREHSIQQEFAQRQIDLMQTGSLALGIEPTPMTCDEAVQVLHTAGYRLERAGYDLWGEDQWKVIHPQKGPVPPETESMTESYMIRFGYIMHTLLGPTVAKVL